MSQETLNKNSTGNSTLRENFNANSMDNSTRQSEKPLRGRTLEGVAKLEGARQMLDLEANRRNLRLAEKQRERWTKANHETIYGSAENASLEDDEMGDMTLGDRVENHYHQPEPKKSGMGTLGKLGVGAALALGGGGIGAAVPLALGLLDGGKEVIESHSSERLEVGEPIVTPPEDAE